MKKMTNKMMRFMKYPVFWILTVFIAGHIPYLFSPISGGHAWRQSDTAAVAKNYYEEDWNFFKPRIDIREDKSGIAGMEFPLFNYLTALLYPVIGQVWDGAGKLFSLFFGFLSILVISKIFESHLRINRTISTFVLCILPVFWLNSGRFMPENMSLFFASLGMYYFIISTSTERNNLSILLFTLFFLLAFLVRPFLIFLGLPLFYYTLFCIYRKHWKLFFLYGSSGLLILTGLISWYLIWNPLLNSQYQLGNYFYMGNISISGAIQLFVNPGFLKNLSSILLQDFILIPFIPFFIYGIYLSIKGETFSLSYSPIYIFILAILNLFFLTVLVQDHYVIHNYYLYSLIPLLSVFTCFGLQNIYQKNRKIYYLISLLSVAATMGAVFHTYRTDPVITELIEYRKEAPKGYSKKDLIVVNGGFQPTLLYTLHARGFSVSDEMYKDYTTIKNLSEKGAKWVLVFEKEKPALIEISRYLDKLSPRKY